MNCSRLNSIFSACYSHLPWHILSHIKFLCWGRYEVKKGHCCFLVAAYVSTPSSYASSRDAQPDLSVVNVKNVILDDKHHCKCLKGINKFFFNVLHWHLFHFDYSCFLNIILLCWHVAYVCYLTPLSHSMGRVNCEISWADMKICIWTWYWVCFYLVTDKAEAERLW